MSAKTIPVPYPGALTVAQAAALRPGTIMLEADYAVGTHVTPEMFNARWRGVLLIFDVNNVNTTGDITGKIQVYDGATWVDLPDAAFANITAAGQVVATVYPSITDDSTAEISAALPTRWRLSVTVADATVNFSVSAFYLP